MLNVNGFKKLNNTHVKLQNEKIIFFKGKSLRNSTDQYV